MELPKGSLLKLGFTLAFLAMTLSHLPYSRAAEHMCYQCEQYASSKGDPNHHCVKSGTPKKDGKELVPVNCTIGEYGCMKSMTIRNGAVIKVTRGCGRLIAGVEESCMKTHGFTFKDGCYTGLHRNFTRAAGECNNAAPTTTTPASNNTDTGKRSDEGPDPDDVVEFYGMFCPCHGADLKACNGGNSFKRTAAFGTGLMMAIGITTAALLSA